MPPPGQRFLPLDHERPVQLPPHPVGEVLVGLGEPVPEDASEICWVLTAIGYSVLSFSSSSRTAWATSTRRRELDRASSRNVSKAAPTEIPLERARAPLACSMTIRLF